MDIQLLLILQKVCNQKNIKLPWDEVGEQLGGTITGGAIIQHLAKLRTRRVNQGLPVPEPLKRGGGETPAAPSGGQKKSKGKGEAGAALDNSNDDDEEDIDIDKASDPEASFGERTKKRGKREADSEDEGDGYGTKKKLKSKKQSKVSKSRKRPGARSINKDGKDIKKEPDTLPIRVTDAKRAARRTSIDYADPDDGEYDEGTDDDPNEPHVAAGSSFLKLEGFSDGKVKKERRAVEHDGSSSQDSEVDEDENASEDGALSLSIGQQGEEGTSNITVLRLNKSERTREFLKTLDNSYSMTASSNNPSPAPNMKPLPMASRISHRASTEQNLNGLTMGTPSHYNNNLMIPYSRNVGLDFGFETHSPYGLNTNINNFASTSSAPYGQATHGLMLPTPMTGLEIPSFTEDLYGNNMMGVQYPNQYDSSASVPSMMVPYTPISGGGFHGHPEYVHGGSLGNMQALYNPVSDFDTRNNSMPSGSTTYGNSQGYNVGEADNNVTESKLGYVHSSLLADQQNASFGPNARSDFLGNGTLDATLDRPLDESDRFPGGLW